MERVRHMVSPCVFVQKCSLIAIWVRRRSFRCSYCAIRSSYRSFGGTDDNAADFRSGNSGRRIGYGWGEYTAVEACDSGNASWKTSVSSRSFGVDRFEAWGM